MFAAGANANKVDDLFVSIGLMSPTKTKLYGSYQELDPFIMDLSKIELKENRVDHSSTIISKKDCSGDISFENINTKHSSSSGSIAVDGSGSTSARKHIFRGNQHCLIVFSLASDEPLLVASHQESCTR